MLEQGCSAFTHRQLLLKKRKSQDGCSNPTSDALLPACSLLVALERFSMRVGRMLEKWYRDLSFSSC